jgi:hypothetical protein
MAKPVIQANPRVQQIFDDLEKYKGFCVDYGYKWDEATLYDQRSVAYRQYQKFVAGKDFRDCWELDSK